MARSSSSSPGSESKTPLVVALVFFILATLTLGITTYMGFGEAKTASESADKANKEKGTTQNERDKDRERVLFYKVLLGTNTPEEKTQFEAARFKDDLKAEHEKLMTAMNDRYKAGLTKQMNDIGLRGDTGLGLKDFFAWPIDASGNLSAPAMSFIDAGVRANAQQQLAQNNLAVSEKAYAEIRTSASVAINGFNKAMDDYKQNTAALPGKIAAEVQKYEVAANATNDKYKADMAKSRESVQQSADALAVAEFEKAREAARGKNLATQLDIQTSQIEARNDPFQFDRPTGRVVRRQIDSKQVEIDLGSADYLKPGIKFSVQPSDTKERGLGARLKQVKGADGKPTYRIQAKANIEVIEIIGPHLSIARITDEFDEIRERVMAGDLLYNSAWRKGSADHICLFGIFDLDADGVDDIQLVINNLTKAGIVVDAYFDLATMKWVGTITERTIFAVEGYVPVMKGLDGNAEYKTRITSAMDEAKKYCKERGAKIVKIRDFFPRIGYDVNFGITDERINQAASKYYTAPAVKEGAEGNKEGK